jgi:hypothetical protein
LALARLMRVSRSHTESLLDLGHAVHLLTGFLARQRFCRPN